MAVLPVAMETGPGQVEPPTGVLSVTWVRRACARVLCTVDEGKVLFTHTHTHTLADDVHSDAPSRTLAVSSGKRSTQSNRQ